MELSGFAFGLHHQIHALRYSGRFGFDDPNQQGTGRGFTDSGRHLVSNFQKSDAAAFNARAGWITISIIALRELSTSILLYSYNSTVLSIMAFDLWEGGQYTYVCALGVLMVLLLLVMAFTARKLGARIGIAE